MLPQSLHLVYLTAVWGDNKAGSIGDRPDLAAQRIHVPYPTSLKGYSDTKEGLLG